MCLRQENTQNIVHFVNVYEAIVAFYMSPTIWSLTHVPKTFLSETQSHFNQGKSNICSSLRPLSESKLCFRDHRSQLLYYVNDNYVVCTFRFGYISPVSSDSVTDLSVVYFKMYTTICRHYFIDSDVKVVNVNM